MSLHITRQKHETKLVAGGSMIAVDSQSFIVKNLSEEGKKVVSQFNKTFATRTNQFG